MSDGTQNRFVRALQGQSPEVVANPYLELYGLRKNPFPTSPAIQPNSTDERSNGDLYDPSIRSQEEQEFDDKFLRPASGDEARLGLLRYGGAPYARGQGKSAFLYHLSRKVHRARRDESVDALAVFMQPQLRPTKKFWHILRLTWESLSKAVDGQTPVAQLVEVDLSLRARALLNILDNDTVERLAAMDKEQVDKLLADRAQIEKELNVRWHQLTTEIRKLLVEVGAGTFNGAFARVLEEVDYEVALTWERGVGRWSDYIWRRDGTAAFLDGLSTAILAAGFTKLFVFLDEYEKIYLYQNARDRSEFLDALRNSVFDSDTVAARYGLLRVILVIHPSVVDQVAGTWSRVGLDRFCSIVGPFAYQRSVTLRELDTDKLRTLLVGYLDHYRKEGHSDQGDINPFTEDAFGALVDFSQGIAGYFLAYSHFILSEAMQDRLGQIDRQLVEEVARTRSVEELDRDVTLFLPPSDVDLTADEEVSG